MVSIKHQLGGADTRENVQNTLFLDGSLLVLDVLDRMLPVVGLVEPIKLALTVVGLVDGRFSQIGPDLDITQEVVRLSCQEKMGLVVGFFGEAKKKKGEKSERERYLQYEQRHCW